MKIQSNDFYLTIDFESLSASWRIIVIDDRWDTVKHMVCGTKDPYTHELYPGLDDKCVQYDAVVDYWNSIATVVEPFERALLLFPWMVIGTEGYRAITFAGFPGNSRILKRILAAPFDPIDEIDEDDIGGQQAILLDIIDDGERRQRFSETWRLLDELGHPPFARAKLTRGGVMLDPQFDSVEKFLKEPPTGGDQAYRDQVRNWLLRMRGCIFPHRYQQITKNVCHNPSDLKAASSEDRKRISAVLANEDPYGVWRWCQNLTAVDPLPMGASRRWLAAKAFQTWPSTSLQVPITALIAILEGSNVLCQPSSSPTQFEVLSELRTIPEDTDKLMILGHLILSIPDYQTFAAALRDWLTLPEQYGAERARIVKVVVSRDQTVSMLRVEFVFSHKLPAEIFTPASTSRRGRGTRTWETLRKFARQIEVSNNPTIALLFDYSS